MNALTDALRLTIADIDECLGFICQHLRTLENRSDRLKTGTLVNSPDYVRYVEKTLLPLRLRMYRDALRRRAEYELAGAAVA